MSGYSPFRQFHKRPRFFGLGVVFLLAGVLCSFLAPSAVHALQVTLAWDSSSEPDLAGYKVYYGTSSRNYTVSYNAGKVYTYAVSNLQAGTTYYFAATAYDQYGNESGFSEEVTYVSETSNNPPVAQNGVLSTNEDTPVSGALSGTDPDGNTLTYAIATQGTLGTVVITNTASGTFTYTPKANVSGSDSFTFTVRDPGGLTATASVAVTIVPVNDAPVAQNGVLSTNEDTPVSGALSGTDPDGNTLTHAIATQGTLGTVVITNAASGTFTYTPNANVSGSDSFTFTVRDPGGLTATASVVVTIVPVNDAPVAQNGSLYTIRGSARSGVLTATDPEGNPLTYAIASQGTKGKAVVTSASTGAYTYTPNRGSKGQDSFTFRATDSGGLSSTATVSVSIIALGNKAPVAASGTVTTMQGNPVCGKLGATDWDGDEVGFEIINQPSLGTLAVDKASGAFNYTPHADSTGTDTFTFKANDGDADSNVASFDVVINPHVKIVLEAESGMFTAPMVVGKDPKASGGKYLWVPNGKGNVTDPLSSGGEAVYSFSVPTAGSYQLWGRIVANNINNNSFFVSMDSGAGIAWHTAIGSNNTWIWDQTRDRNDPTPVSFYLEAGEHTLAIKQMEDGTKLDSILITTQTGWMGETVYCNAEKAGTDGWEVFDAAPSGALISSVFDEERARNVIELSGSRDKNGYRLRSESLTNWANTSQFVMEWSLKYDEKFVIYVEVQTTAGTRYLQYEPVSADHLGDAKQVKLGLGPGAKNGQWHTFVRDLQADLSKAQEDATILQVNSFSIRGSGMVDDIKLRQAI